MRFALLLVVLTATAHADPKPKIQLAVTADVVPKVSLGGIRLGATRDSLGASFAETIQHIGPYTVSYDQDGKVSHVSLALVAHGKGVRIAGARIAASTSLEQLVKRVPGCGAIESRIGGRISRCANGVHVSAGGPPGIVAISIEP